MDYLGGFQYQDNVLKHFPTAEGYVSHVSGSYQYVFNYTDHLGNIRLSFGWDMAEGKLKIMEENHYYPFGLKHANYNTHTLGAMKKEEGSVMTLKAMAAPSTPKPVMGYNYKYNGKEYQDELGLNLYDYGARNYDVAIGRWMNIDPLAEKFTHMSPYNYGMNNPIYFIDPNGMASDGWIRRDDSGQTSMTYDPNVNTVSEAVAANYTKVVSVSETAKISSTSGSYSYDLNADGSVTNSSDGSNITFHKPIVTEGGATVGGAFQTGQGTKIYTSNTGPKAYPFPLERGNIESMDFGSPFFLAGGIFKSAFGSPSGTIVYRAVDATEGSIIKNTRAFSLQAGGVESKYFAQSLSDAHWYGKALYPDGYTIIKATVKPTIDASKHWYPYVDIGAYVFPREALPYIIPK